VSNPDPILVKAANIEFNRWADFLYHRPYTTKVVAEFIDEIQDAFEKIRDHPNRYPLEGYSDYRRFGPTCKHHFKVIYTVRNGVIWIVAIAHPARRMR
jgi:plasmid stabilization system protein ParE